MMCPRDGLCWLAVAVLLALPAGAIPAPARHWTPAEISTADYESSPTFSPDGREMFFMRANRAFTAYQLLASRCLGSGWSPPVPVPFGLPAPVDDADPFLTADGRSLYFVSSRPFPGKHGEDLDVWWVERERSGGWGTPERLPEPINSPHTELLPRLTAEGRIYFGSDRPGGLGGQDIYLASQAEDGAWRATNLGPEVNTPANEFEAEVSPDERTLVVVSDREGRSHLYRYQRIGGRWVLAGRVPAQESVFQVGPVLSPRGDRLLFAQAVGERSGELFLIDLEPDADPAWPPHCGERPAPAP